MARDLKKCPACKARLFGVPTLPGFPDEPTCPNGCVQPTVGF